jgi:hypothetical protein
MIVDATVLEEAHRVAIDAHRRCRRRRSILAIPDHVGDVAHSRPEEVLGVADVPVPVQRVGDVVSGRGHGLLPKPTDTSAAAPASPTGARLTRFITCSRPSLDRRRPHRKPWAHRGLPIPRTQMVAGRQKGGGLFRSVMRSVTYVVSRRTAAMALVVLSARVCRRLGIIMPRSPVSAMTGGSPAQRVAVGWHSFGNRCLLPGWVT